MLGVRTRKAVSSAEDNHASSQPLQQPQSIYRLDVWAERISTLDVQHSTMAKSVECLNVKVIAIRGEIAMPTISADT